jgi:hypothetical protein
MIVNSPIILDLGWRIRKKTLPLIVIFHSSDNRALDFFLNFFYLQILRQTSAN